MKPLDIARCWRGMQQLEIRGSARPAVIEDAITLIQRNPHGALRQEYLGVKNYAGFGDQRENHSYGFGPKHGHIVFRIGLTDAWLKGDKALDADAVYLLEAYRDVPDLMIDDRQRRDVLSLCDVLRRLRRAEQEVATLRGHLDAAQIDAHLEETR